MLLAMALGSYYKKKSESYVWLVIPPTEVVQKMLHVDYATVNSSTRDEKKN